MNPETYSRFVSKFGVERKIKTRLFNNTEKKSAKQFSILARAFIRPLWVSRNFGNNPLYFTKVEHGNTGIFYRNFEFKRFSWLTTFSFLQQISYIVMFGGMAYRLFHGDYRASNVPGTGMKIKHSSAYADGLMQAFLTTFFLACAGGAFSSFCSTPKLSKYLNKWKDFTFEFSKVFPDKFIDFAYVNKISTFGWYFSISLCSSYIIWAVFIYKTCIFNTNNKCTWMEREQSIMTAGFGCASTLNTTFENYKLVLMMRTIAYAFSQIKDHLDGSKSYFSNRTTNLKNLFHLIHGLRGQTALLGDIFGTTQLLILFFLFSLTIIGWMMVMQLSEGDIGLPLVLVVSSFGFVQFARFSLVAVLSERILDRERSLLDEISEIELHSVKAQIEVQIFVNLVTKKPSEFIVNNVIIWRRSLFLALLSNAATYLIAIMQLAGVSNSDTTIGLSSSGSNFTQQEI